MVGRGLIRKSSSRLGVAAAAAAVAVVERIEGFEDTESLVGRVAVAAG